MKKLKIIIILSIAIISNTVYSQTWQTYDTLRSVYQKKQSYDTALVYSEKALDVLKNEVGENDTLYADMLTEIVFINYILKNHKLAIEYCNNELRIRELTQGKRHSKYALALYNLSAQYIELGDFSKAEVLTIEAMSIWKSLLGENNSKYAASLNNLAHIYQKMGNYSAAENMCIKANSIDKETSGAKSHNYARSLNNLAMFYFTMGNYPAAEPLYVEAIDIFKEVNGEKHPYYAAAMENLAGLYKATGNYMLVEPLYIKAMNIRKEVFGEKHPNFALSLNNLAELYKDMGNYSLAESLYIEAINIRKIALGENHPDYAQSINHLAILYGQMCNYSAAEPLFVEAKNIRKDIFGTLHPTYANSLNNLAKLYYKMGHYVDARDFYIEGINIINVAINQNFAFLSEKEKELYLNTQAGTFAGFYSYSLRYKTEKPEITEMVFNNIVKNKGMLLKSSTAMRTAILNCNDTTLIVQYEKWIALKKEISKLYSTEISKRAKNPDELDQQANTIEKELVKGSQTFSDFEKLQNLTWESVKNNLKPSEAAIEFIHFQENKDTTLYCALIITPESQQPEMIRLFEEKEIKAILDLSDKNNFKYVNGIYGTNENTNEALYKLIWQPLEPYLKDVRTVYYSPDGILHKISFSALGKGKNIYLCDNYNLQQVSSTGRVAMPESPLWDENLTAGLFGGIEFSADTSIVKIWNYLPGTKIEADKIAGVFNKKKIKTIYFSGSTATEDTIKAIASNCNILHISTHGFFYPDPEQVVKEEKTEEKTDTGLVAFRGGVTGFGIWQFVKNKNPLMRSGIVMAGANNVWNQRFAGEGEDGVLTAQEVTQLDLSKTKLVVLSACETGLGDIKGSEGVYGLQRAFKMAGVKYIIMSLWQVPDKETVEFMETFYKKLLKSKDVRKSFNETQKEMRKKYDPYYWAAFVLVE